MESTPRLFVFGLGYSALAVARELKEQGWRVAGTCRSEDKRAALAAEGIEAHLFDRGRPLDDPKGALADTTHLLISVPPDEAGDAVLDHHAEDIVRVRPQWIGYLSTTGVYGDHGGAWIDETTPLAPGAPRTVRRAEAEGAWLRLGNAAGLPVHVFRLAGIYGPGRSALDSVREGRARRIVKEGQIFSRVHVADIVGVVRASMAKPNPGAIYNVCDDEPTPPQDVVVHACELLGVAPPPPIPFEQAELSPMARSFYADNKRVSNRRIKDELGYQLRHPDYRSGLRAILEQGG